LWFFGRGGWLRRVFRGGRFRRYASGRTQADEAPGEDGNDLPATILATRTPVMLAASQNKPSGLAHHHVLVSGYEQF